MRHFILILAFIISGCSYNAYPDWVYQPRYRTEVFIPQPIVGYSFYNRYVYGFNPYNRHRVINPYFYYIERHGIAQIWSNQPFSPWHPTWYNNWDWEWRHWNLNSFYLLNTQITTTQVVNTPKTENNIIVAPRRSGTNNYAPRTYSSRPRPQGRTTQPTIRKSPNQRILQPTKNVKQQVKNTQINLGKGKRTGNN